AMALCEALRDHAIEDDLQALGGAAAFALARAWVDAIATSPDADASIEAAARLATPKLARVTSSAVVEHTITGLYGRHPRIDNGALRVRLDELLARVERFRSVEVPAFRAHRALRAELIARERARLRIDELRPQVMSS